MAVANASALAADPKDPKEVAALLSNYAKEAPGARPGQRIQLIRGFIDQAYEEVLELAKREIIAELKRDPVDSGVVYEWSGVIASFGAKKEANFLSWVEGEVNAFHTHLEATEARLLGIKLAKLYPQMDSRPPVKLLALENAVGTAGNGKALTTEQIHLNALKIRQPNTKYGYLDAGTDTVLSQEILELIKDRQWIRTLNRDEEINRALDVLVRLDSRVPFLLGNSRVGKTAIANGLFEKIVRGLLPAGVISDELSKAFVLRTTPQSIAALAQYSTDQELYEAMDNYLQDLQRFEKDTGLKVVLFVDNADQLQKGQLNALKKYLENRSRPLRLVMAGTLGAGASAIMDDGQMRALTERIPVFELGEAAALQVIRQTQVPAIEARYQVRFDDDVIKQSLEIAAELRPDVPRPEGPTKLLQDLAIQKNRATGGQPGQVTLKDLYAHAAKEQGLPVVPQDREAFYAYMQDVKSKVKLVVRGQDATVERIGDLIFEAMTSKTRRNRKVVVIGNTGIGKTFIAETFAKIMFEDWKERFLEIDGTQISSDDHGHYLLGPKAGYRDSEKKGLLTDHADKVKAKFSFAVINEGEKMDDSQWTRLMEPFDKNYFTPGDGRLRVLGRMLWIITSNKGATKFFPADFLRKATPQLVADKIASVTEQDLKNAFLEKQGADDKSKLGPEIFERTDSVILQAPILKETATEIAALKANDEIRQIELQGQGTVDLDDAFAKVYTDETYDPANGIRGLERKVRAAVNDLYDAHLRKYGKSERLEVLTLPPLPGKETVRFEVTNERGQVLVVDGPKKAYSNPLLNPVYKDKLKGLEAGVNREIFGQTEYVKKVASVFLSSAVDRQKPKPPSVYVSGMTAQGKSALPKALARYMFGSEEYLATFEMGMIADAKGMADIFQPTQGYAGSSTPGRFERFLMSHKYGILHFEEMGNAGGRDLAAREEICKMFYSILDDGVWVSPVTQKTYYLKNYLVMFSGNEAERIYGKHTQDDMLRAIYEEYKAQHKIRNILIESGLSKAFLGRVGSVILSEPPTTLTKQLVSSKLIREWQARIEAENPVRIRFDEGFLDQVARLTYTSTQGARSVLSYIEDTLGGLNSRAIFELDYEKATAANPAEVFFSLEVKAPYSPLYRGLPTRNMAKLVVTVKQNGLEIFKEKVDFTDSAVFMKQIKQEDAIATDFHEAAHAVLNDPLVSGETLEHLTVIPADGYLGYARYKPIPGYVTNHTMSSIRARLVVFFGGSEAEKLIGRETNSGQSGDLKEERSLLTRAAVEWGLVPELEGAILDADGNAKMTASQMEAFEKFANREIELARKTARELLIKKWWLVRQVAGELMRKGEIPGTRFEELRREFVKKSVASGFNDAYLAKFGPEIVSSAMDRISRRNCNLAMKQHAEQVLIAEP